jgi:hypothetical protein
MPARPDAKVLEIIHRPEGPSTGSATQHAGAQCSFSVRTTEGGLARVRGRARAGGAGETGVNAERIVHVGARSAAIPSGVCGLLRCGGNRRRRRRQRGGRWNRRRREVARDRLGSTPGIDVRHCDLPTTPAPMLVVFTLLGRIRIEGFAGAPRIKYCRVFEGIAQMFRVGLRARSRDNLRSSRWFLGLAPC